MKVAGVVSGADGAEIERDLSRGVCTVDERVDAARAHLRNDALDRQNERGLAGDVIDQQQARALGDFPQHALDYVVRRGDGERHVDDHDLRAGEAAGVVEHVARGVVFVRGDEQLVVLVEVERAQHGIDAGGCVGDEGDVLRLRADERRDLGARGVEQRLELAHHEPHRLALQPCAVLVLLGQHCDGRGAEGAVIEVGDGGVKKPVLLHGTMNDEG